MAGSGGFDDVVEGSVLVFNLVEPDRVDFVPLPLVGQDAGVSPLPVVDVVAGGAGAVPLGVERRVGGDEVDGLIVHAAQDVEVVELVEDVVGEVLVRVSRCAAPLLRCDRNMAIYP